MALHCPKCTCEWDTLISSSSVLLFLPFCIQHSSCDDHLHMEFRYVTRILWNGCVSRILFSFFSFAFALSLSLCIVNAILSFHFSAAIFFISAVHSFFFFIFLLLSCLGHRERTIGERASTTTKILYNGGH